MRSYCAPFKCYCFLHCRSSLLVAAAADLQGLEEIIIIFDLIHC